MIAHADKYSPAFSALNYQKLINGKVKEEDLWKYSSFWYQNFDEMAKKTMLRQLISRWGVMSIEMQDAYTSDEKIKSMGEDFNIITEDAELEVVEPEEKPVEKPEEKKEAAEVSMDDL